MYARAWFRRPSPSASPHTRWPPGCQGPRAGGCGRPWPSPPWPRLDRVRGDAEQLHPEGLEVFAVLQVNYLLHAASSSRAHAEVQEHRLATAELAKRDAPALGRRQAERRRGVADLGTLIGRRRRSRGSPAPAGGRCQTQESQRGGEERPPDTHRDPSSVVRRRSNSSASISPRAWRSSRMRTGPPVRGADLLTAHAPKTISATRTSRPGNHIHQLIPNIDPISQPSTEHLLLPGSHACIATNGPPYSRWFSNRWI